MRLNETIPDHTRPCETGFQLGAFGSQLIFLIATFDFWVLSHLLIRDFFTFVSSLVYFVKTFLVGSCPVGP